MAIIATKNPGDVIQSTDFNALINKIQNGTDTDIKLSGATTSDIKLINLIRNCATTTTPLVSLTLSNTTDSNEAVVITKAGTGNTFTIYQSNASASIALNVYGSSNINLVDFRNNTKGANTNIATFCDTNTSWVGYFARNLSSSDTSNPVVVMENNNAGDDQPVLSLKQVGTGYDIYKSGTSTDLKTNFPGIILSSQSKIYTSAADNIWIKTWTNTPNPNFSIACGDGAGGISWTWVSADGSSYGRLDLMPNGGYVNVGRLASSTITNSLNIFNTGTGSHLYLQPKSSAPTTSLSDGCVYYDSSKKSLMTYDGSKWREVGSMEMSVSGAKLYNYVVTASGVGGVGNGTYTCPSSTTAKLFSASVCARADGNFNVRILVNGTDLGAATPLTADSGNDTFTGIWNWGGNYLKITAGQTIVCRCTNGPDGSRTASFMLSILEEAA